MKKAFTLIELLIVIAVISILVGIALPRFKGMRDEGLIAQAKGELRTLQTAVESFYTHTGAYPTTFPDDLESATPLIIHTTAPTDPFNGTTDYGYADDSASPVKYYVIYSVGPGATAGSASVTAAGVASDTQQCIYVTNGSPRDTSP